MLALVKREKKEKKEKMSCLEPKGFFKSQISDRDAFYCFILTDGKVFL